MRHLVVALAMALLLVPGPAAGAGSAPVAFLANTGGGNVLMVDTSSGSVTPVLVGEPTYGVAVDLKGARAYVTTGFTDLSGRGKLYVIDTATGKLVGTVTVGVAPYGVAVSRDGSRVFVANVLDSSVSVIDAAAIGSGQPPVIATLSAGGFPWGVAVASSSGPVYVSNIFGSLVTAIDPATNAVKQVPADGGAPSGIALSPDGSRLYLAEYGGSRLWVVDVAKIGGPGAIINRVTVGPAPYAVAVNRDGTRVYVTISGGDAVSVIDASTPGSEFLAAKVTVGSKPMGVAITADGSRVYVANNNSQSLSVISAATNAVVGTVPLPANTFPIAFGNFLTPIRVISVTINVVPGVVNLKQQGTLPVIIYGSESFDVHTADLATIKLNGLPVKIKPNGEPMANYGDFNGDGLDDVMVHIDMGGGVAMQAASGNTVTLEGQTFDGLTFQGTAPVKFQH